VTELPRVAVITLGGTIASSAAEGGAATVRISGADLLARIPQARQVASLPYGRLEHLARGHGLAVLRLDTRHDLVEARRLYATLGYEEVHAFNDGRYAEHWLAKPLA